MLVTKNAAELCVLLIKELYGQLPSRIFGVLLSRGRLTAAELAHHTSLPQRQVLHGLCILIQYNIVFHYTEPDATSSHYDANPDSAYNIVRSGKVLEMVGDTYGDLAKRQIHHIMQLGFVRVGELMDACQSATNQTTRMNGSPAPNHSEANGLDVPVQAATDPAYKDQFWVTIARLIATGLVEPVTARMINTPQDVKTEIERELMNDAYRGGPRGAKQKLDLENRTKERWEEFQDESRMLKRQLESEYLTPSYKRRKLANGTVATNGHADFEEEELPFSPDIIVRLNPERCLIELRNYKLVTYVEDEIGETTAEVYASLLAVLSRKLATCRDGLEGPELDFLGEGEDFSVETLPFVTSKEIITYLDSSIDLSVGIGRSKREDMDGIDGDLDTNTLNGHHTNGANGTQEATAHSDPPGRAKVKFHDAQPNSAQRMNQMRQHLLVLSESGNRYLTKRGSRDGGEWTVDFSRLMRNLRLSELDTLIEDSFGRLGLRLTRILREKGKLDDKTLYVLALMKKGDVHVKMVEMEMAGFLDVQEVPRDNNRTANRTIFLWFFDETRTLARVLDNTYKSMVRCLQRLEVERRKKRNVLSVVNRKDVQGMEEERLRGDIYSEYRQFLDIESKLVGQVMKLDDLVSVLRDF